MTQETNNPNPRLDELLKRWGSQEATNAARTPAFALPPQDAPADQGDAATPAKLDVPTRKRFRIYVSIAAAAGLVIGVGLTLLCRSGATGRLPGSALSIYEPRHDKAGRSAAQSSQPAAGDEAELVVAKAEIERLTAQLRQAESARRDAEQKLAAAITPEMHQSQLLEMQTRLQQDFDAKRQQILDDANVQVTQLKTTLAQKEGELRHLGELEKQLAEAVKAANDSKRVQAIAAEEMNRLRQMHTESLKAVENARAEAGELSVQLAAMTADFQKAYLAAIGDGASGLAACQRAAKKSQMAGRCATVRQQAGNEATRKLIDQIEVAFLRLGQLNTNDASAVQAFTALVQQGGLLAKIDATLQGGNEKPSVRSFLFEAKLILTGAGSAG